MATTTFQPYTGDGSDKTFDYSFPTFTASEVVVEVDGVIVDNYTIPGYQTTGTRTVTFDNTTGTLNTNVCEADGAPKNGLEVIVRRDTNVDTAKATFTAGSSLKAEDLTNTVTQILRSLQEEQNTPTTTPRIRNSQITSAKIKDGTIQTADIAADQITNALIADDQIDSEHYVDGSIDLAHMSANSVDSDQYVDGSIDRIHLEADIIDGTKLADSAVNSEHITAGSVDLAHMSANSIDSDQYVDGSIDHVHLSNDCIDGDNIQDDVINSEHYVAGSIDHEHLATDIIDGDNIQDNAINSEHYVDGSIDHEHLSNDCVDADNIQDNAVGSEHIQTNAVTDSEIATGTLDGRYYTETELNAGQLDTRYFTEAELTSGALDGRYFTETEAEAAFLRQDSSETIASGVTWSGTDSKVATTAAIDLRIIELVDNVGGFVPIANETSFPADNPDINTSGSAKGGTIVSVKTASTNLTAQSGTTLTIANGRGTGNAVIITGVSATIPQGYGFLVETTQTDHTYAFHRLVPKATEVATVAANAVNIAAAGANVTNIDSFADRYQISTSAPTTRTDGSNLTLGDLWFDSSSNKVMMVYDASSGDGFSPITPNQATLTNINIVAGQITYTEDLGNITDAINTGSGNNSVNTVGSNIANVNTAATNIAKINTVADDLNEPSSEIDTVATNITNVNTVGNAITNVNTVAGSIGNVNTVQGSISNVNTAATNIASINTAASNISNVNNFTDRYQIASSDPSTDGGGNSLAAGDLYFNTSANELKVYTGSAWQGGVTATGNFAATTGNTFSGSNIHNDNVKSIYGTSSDGLEIFHNSNNSIINDTGTGNLQIQTGGNTKLEVVSTGVTVTGLVSATTIDGSAGNNLTLDFGTL